MRGIVWGSTTASAKSKLNHIIDKYIEFGYRVEDQSNNKFNAYVTFSNGDIWRAVRACESVRGIKCNVSYIERNISYDVYRTIIEPCTSRPPFTAIRLYGEGNLHITDQISELPFA